MSEEWKSLAQQIADLKRQVAELTRERDMWKSACELRDAQLRAGIITVRPPDDIIEINPKDLK